ncbi:MAG: DsbA family protein [Pseudomonadota bacterium]
MPIASFSDYNCPFCKVLTQKLAALEDAGGVSVTWHEWPLLGEASMQAAQAALAADAQGAYAAFHKRLMRSRFRPTPEYLREIARSLDIDADRMLSDMASAAVAKRLADTAALSSIFGFPGTPALVVGRTVVVGAISDATLAALVEQERRDGPPEVCNA